MKKATLVKCNDRFIFPVNTSFFYAVLFLLYTCTFLSGRIALAQPVCTAQTKLANFWYFGANAALDFSSGTPVAVSGSALSVSEGCATISDVNGNLLFYAGGNSFDNGLTVYDKTNHKMPNGNNSLWGNGNATQAALIVPDPGDKNQYYLFTVDPQAGFVPGLGTGGAAYSVIDMTLNGGLGDVTSVKNVPLLALTAEKITGVRHCNGKDVWVIIHEYHSDAFYTYLVSASGVGAPVISHIGSVYKDPGYPGNPTDDGTDGIGYLKSSPNGKKLACAKNNSNDPTHLELFDFDNATGIISNAVDISAGTGGGYGVEFSPDNTKLYVSFPETNSAGLYQFDLNAANISASKVTLSTGAEFYALQRANDGKIYVVYDDFNNNAVRLDAINNPDIAGPACNYAANAVPSVNGMENLGLPNFIAGYFDVVVPKIDLGPDLSNQCIGALLTLDAGNTCAGMYLWSTGATTQTIGLNPTSTNSYSVTVTNNMGCTASDQITVQLAPPIVPNASGPAQAICPGSSTTISAAFQNGYTYRWAPANSLSATTGSAVTAMPAVNTTYTVTVTDGNNCTASDKVVVNLSTQPMANTSGPSQAVCPGTPVTISAAFQNNFTYQWAPANGLSATTGSAVTATPAGNTTYTVTVTDGNSCTATGAVAITLAPTPTVSGGPARVVCNGLPVTIGQNIPQLGNMYQWASSNGTVVSGTANPSVTPTANATYTVTVTNNTGCTATSSVNISTGLGDVHVPAKVKLCKGADTALNPGGNIAYTYHWSPSAGLSTITGANPKASPTVSTTYTVTVNDPNITNGPCPVVSSEVVDVSVAPLMVSITSNNPLPVCPGTASVLTARSNNSHTRFAWFADRTFNNQLNTNLYDSVFTVTPGITTTYYLKPYNDYCSNSTDSIVVLQDDMRVFPDTAYICLGRHVQIGLKNPYNLQLSYKWYSSGSVIYGPDDTEKIDVAPDYTVTYFVSVKNQHGCEAVAFSAVMVGGDFTTVLKADKTDIIKGDQVVLSAQPVYSGYTYIWAPATGLTSMSSGAVITTSPIVSTTYHVRIAANGKVNGCLGEDSIAINVHEKNACDPESIYIPNAFSPNGDGQNDVLYIRSKMINDIQCQVYNRWGNKVAEINNINNGWDGFYNGEPADNGVYIYFLRYKCTVDGQVYLKKGNVSILR